VRPARDRIVVPVAELRRRPGNRMVLERDVPIGDLATSSAAVPSGVSATLTATLESLSDGVTVVGRIHVPWEGSCRRCLDPCVGELDVDFSEVFSDHPDGGDLLAFSGDAVDLTDAVREAVVLGLPLAPLCREDCAGPEPSAFPVAVESEGAVATRDPRWAALDALRFDPEADDG